jgi:hypothetical protein
MPRYEMTIVSTTEERLRDYALITFSDMEGKLTQGETFAVVPKNFLLETADEMDRLRSIAAAAVQARSKNQSANKSE